MSDPVCAGAQLRDEVLRRALPIGVEVLRTDGTPAAGGQGCPVSTPFTGPPSTKVDAAYHEKYGRRYASIVDRITDDEHRATTLRLTARAAG
jgi:hypothetical protein